MSTHGGDSAFPKPQPPQSGIRTVLQYTGIPPSLFDKRPRLPSRNWLIFLSVTSAVAGYYFYDRRQCKQIRQEYVNKVKHLSEAPLHSLDYPRKVTVYGCKWPADEDYDRSMKYFRKYVKPILVAAAADYEMINGRRYGDLAERIANDIKKRRRLEAGLDQPPPSAIMVPNNSLEAKKQREMAGGIVIVGRPAFKEFMAGLKRGWTESLEWVDKEEQLANELSNDGAFDEPEPETKDIDIGEGEPLPTASRLAPSSPYSVLSPSLLKGPTSTRSQPKDVTPSATYTPPAVVPLQPPILFVSFLNYIGFRQIPLMIWEFFNERHKARAGAEAAYRLIVGETRPFVGPPAPFRGSADFDYQQDTSPQPTDLDFDKDVEGYYKSSMINEYIPEIEKARENYYEELKKKLATTRALARGEREPTKDEVNYPPPSEVELRAERLKKELRWRSDQKGWEIIKPDSPVAWDERFSSIFRVFVEPTPDTEQTFAAHANTKTQEDKS